MENLPLCRICLADDVRLCSIESHLRDMYERITSMTFAREDGRPQVACYICRARLQNCYRLQTSSLRSENLLTEIIQCISSGGLKPETVLSANSFGVASVLHLSLGHENEDSTECHAKKESLEVFCDAEPEGTVSKNQEEQSTKVDDKSLCMLEDPLDIIKREPDDEETDAIEVKLEIEDMILEENEPNGADLPSSSQNDICPKIVLESVDLSDPRTDVPVVKKLAETDSHLVTDLEDNICKQTAASNIHKANDEVDATLPIHSDNKAMIRYECHTCTRSFKDITSLRKHLYKHTGEKPYQCLVCNKCFRSKQLLKQHANTHIAERRFQCDVCKKCFKSKQYLTQHMYTHTGEKQFECDVCKKFFKSKQCLKQHMYAHIEERRFKCDVCNKCFKTNNNKTRHMYRHTGGKKFQCDLCNKCFNNKQHLEQHMSIHIEVRPFKCDVCNKCFRSKRHLTQHKYAHTGEKQFNCEMCNKCFKSKRYLTQHMYTHTGEKQFPCDMCNKCFKSKQYLTQHMYTHTGEKQFGCDVCNKFFKSKQCLKRHMYAHIEERRFKCDVCNKCFKTNNNKTRHMYIHTGGKNTNRQTVSN